MHVYGWNKIPDLLEIFILMWCQLNFNPQDKQTMLLSSFRMSNGNINRSHQKGRKGTRTCVQCCNKVLAYIA